MSQRPWEDIENTIEDSLESSPDGELSTKSVREAIVAGIKMYNKLKHKSADTGKCTNCDFGYMKVVEEKWEEGMYQCDECSICRELL